MFATFHHALLLAALMSPLAGALAQRAPGPEPVGRTTRADPMDAAAPVPPVVYRSSFAGYRGLAEVPVGSWRDANDRVGRIGGWRAYAREVADGAPAALDHLPATDGPAPAAGVAGNDAMPSVSVPDARPAPRPPAQSSATTRGHATGDAR